MYSTPPQPPLQMPQAPTCTASTMECGATIMAQSAADMVRGVVNLLHGVFFPNCPQYFESYIKSSSTHITHEQLKVHLTD